METGMSLEFCVLGSGSSGNSTVVRAPWGAFLLDAGFGPRTTDQRMHGIGLSVKDISAIVLTHLDHDHFNPNWLLTLVKQQIRLHIARGRLREFLHFPEVRDLEGSLEKRRLPGDALRKLLEPFDEAVEPLRGVRMEALALAHDAAGSHGFLIECDGHRAGFATDLGRVPKELIERFCGVDLLAIESNYDPEMESNSDRPYYLKRRIMGGGGHLSNEQALAAIISILDRTAETCGATRLPRHIVLLHRSGQCNCPKLVRRMFSADSRIAPVLTLADQYERTGWLGTRQTRVEREEQLALAWA
jgi:phosphoribosyl 1,2-cyclic phosphodiesterase